MPNKDAKFLPFFFFFCLIPQILDAIVQRLILPFLHTDLLYIALAYSEKLGTTASSRVTLKCFCESFRGISGVPFLLSDLPACCKAMDGPGILIDLTDKSRWKSFATWTIKLLSKCLTDGTLYVEGLISASFVSAACNLLCYGDAAMHMVGSVLSS